MKIGIISDIHSNSEALQSVMTELRIEGVHCIINAGDNVGYSAFPDACVKTIQSEGFYNVMGNYDDAVAYDRVECGCGEGDAETLRLREASLLWTQKNTSRETKDYLATLPGRLELKIGGTTFFAIHGGLNFLNEFIYEQDDAALLNIADRVKADIIVLGHTHKPFVREIKGKVFINPGSVGKPVDGDPRASCAIVELGGWNPYGNPASGIRH
jgi:putative phosphoesterase